MKNIEKFTSTASALHAWKLLPEGRLPFHEWLMADSDPCTRRGTLLWKARNLLNEINRLYPPSGFCSSERLALAQVVRAEENTPTKRYELYTTPDAAHEAFHKMCRTFPQCNGCPYQLSGPTEDWNCQLRWLYDEPTEVEYRKEMTDGKHKDHAE